MIRRFRLSIPLYGITGLAADSTGVKASSPFLFPYMGLRRLEVYKGPKPREVTFYSLIWDCSGFSVRRVLIERNIPFYSLIWDFGKCLEVLTAITEKCLLSIPLYGIGC